MKASACGGDPMDIFMPRATMLFESVTFPSRTAGGYGAQAMLCHDVDVSVDML